jgi:hypothetical protein
MAKLPGGSGRTELFVWLDVGTAQAALCTLGLPEFARKNCPISGRRRCPAG